MDHGSSCVIDRGPALGQSIVAGMNTFARSIQVVLLTGEVSLLLVSCSTQMYSGDRRDKEEVATLRENPKQYLEGYNVSIFKVNGRDVRQAAFGIDVPPGRTRVTALVHGPITPRNPNGYQSVDRTFQAKRNHLYIFEVQPGSSSQPRLVIREEAR